MELNKDELQYILTAIDTHVRHNGLNAAGHAVAIATKIHGMGNSAATPAPPAPPDDKSKPSEH